ncbi:MAG: hypothetical protein GWP41_00325 [Planctomycetia bacterium]|jgi:hypothetical protein|nr:hypothetical protein [Planctomycetia bacterium]NCF99954.1 hypothetical protein [Planctomycetia bacterium]NCG12800.1 hypothetical protein [Planctomycetia bacterium]
MGMVYFGPKKYRPERVGLSNRERFRILGSIVLLIALVLTVWSAQKTDTDSATTPVYPAEVIQGSSVPSADVVPDNLSNSQGEAPAPVSLPEISEPASPEPFRENPALLDLVRDGEALLEGPDEMAGLYYLLHRWRSDWAPSEITEPPAVPELAERSKELRGQRFLFVISLIENPRVRLLPPNKSNLTRVWEAFGSDRSGRLHRVNFISKPRNLPRGTDVLVTGDFFRLYTYEDTKGRFGMVPEWVCGRLDPYENPFSQRSKWSQNSFWILSAIGGFTLIMGAIFYSRSIARRPLRKKSNPRKDGSRPSDHKDSTESEESGLTSSESGGSEEKDPRGHAPHREDDK